LIAAFVRGLHELCTLNADMIPTSRLSDFASVMQAYRQISNVFHAQIQLLDPQTSSHFNLLTRLQEISGEHPHQASYFILDQEPQHWFSPTQYKTFRRYSSHYAIEYQENSWFAPTQYKTYRRNSSHFTVQPEETHHLSVNRVLPAPVWSLAFGDGTANAVYDGRISMLKDGQVVQTIQAIPDPTNSQFMMLSVDSGGEIHWENSATHGTHGGTSGSADGYIAGLEYDTTAGSAFLGHITAIRQPGGVILRSLDSTTALHHSKTQVLALVATLQNQIDSNSLVINALQTAVTGLGNTLNALSARVATLETNALTMKFENGTSSQLHEIQFKTGHFPGSAYYPATGNNPRAILKIQTSTPTDQNPY